MRVRCCGWFALTAIFLALTSSWSAAAVVTRLQNGENLRMTAIGTSLTKSASAVWFDTQLPNWLNTLGPGRVAVFNEAIAGSASSYGASATGQPASSSGLYDQLHAALAHNPDVVFIEFSINDAYLPYGLDLATSKSNLKSMIDQVLAKAADTEVIVQTMNNCLPGSTDAQNRPELAAYYRGYCDVISAYYASNPRVLLVDNYTDWVALYQTMPTTWSKYVSDGIHPHSDGTAAITIPNIQAALRAQAIPEPNALSLLGCGLAAFLFASACRMRI